MLLNIYFLLRPWSYKCSSFICGKCLLCNLVDKASSCQSSQPHQTSFQSVKVWYHCFSFSVSLRVPVITILFLNSNCWIEERERGREGRREEKERKGNEFQFLDGWVDEGEERGRNKHKAQCCVYLLESVFALLSHDLRSTAILSLGIIRGCKKTRAISLPFCSISITYIFFSINYWIWNNPVWPQIAPFLMPSFTLIRLVYK